MDGEGGLVDRPLTLDHLALVVHEAEVGYPDVCEVHAEGVDPEMVGQLGVAGGDVAGDALVEPELGEQPEPGRETLLAVQALLFDRRERRGLARLQLGHDSTSVMATEQLYELAGDATAAACRSRQAAAGTPTWGRRPSGTACRARSSSPCPTASRSTRGR